MTVHLATKTLELIKQTIEKDQGASFRGWLEKTIPHMGDAYRTDNFPFRSHLGASGIGRECAREIWYGFRWTTLPNFPDRILRLFNRGHLEEARFLSMLLMIGCDVYQQDENGNQFRISDAGGHFGGSGDGVAIGIPDLEPGTTVLCEFKTSAEKPFLKVKKEGVRVAKFEHYVQMQTYMKKMGLAIGLYVVVNKNNDELYAELVPFNDSIAEQFIQRGVNLVWTENPPDKISKSAGWFACKFCDHRPVCHLDAEPCVNCRTCKYSEATAEGAWICDHPVVPVDGSLSKEQQLEGCVNYDRKF